MTTIIEDRFKALDSITLQRGAHDPNGDKQFCAMEAAAWIAGEEHSDRPQCVSPVLAAGRWLQRNQGTLRAREGGESQRRMAA